MKKDELIEKIFTYLPLNTTKENSFLKPIELKEKDLHSVDLKNIVAVKEVLNKDDGSTVTLSTKSVHVGHGKVFYFFDSTPPKDGEKPLEIKRINGIPYNIEYTSGIGTPPDTTNSKIKLIAKGELLKIEGECPIQVITHIEKKTVANIEKNIADFFIKHKESKGKVKQKAKPIIGIN